MRIEKIVSLVDVMPTILSILNIPKPPGLDGYNLCPLWRKADAELPERFLFAEADHNNIKNDIKRAVRHPRYKLHYDRITEEIRLYDLLIDPAEKTDITSK